MLPEGEDLLKQLSGELGIPEFLEDMPMLEESEMPSNNGLYDTLMNEGIFDDFSPTILETRRNGLESNFTIDFGAFPPSPSNSDSSANSVIDTKDGILSSPGYGSGSSSEISPPVSPPAMPVSTSIVSVSDLSNVKIPIPKIQKPSK